MPMPRVGMILPDPHPTETLMSKKTTAAIVALLGIVGVQQWMLHRPKTPADDTATAPSAIAAERPDRAIAEDAVADRLARIDARLSSLETDNSVAPAPQRPDVVLGSPEALAADRKIAALLPHGPLTQAHMLQLQMQLAQYPASERVQLSAALARAINNGQVQIASAP